MSKYHAKPIYANGEAFDSKKEANRWAELQLLQRCGTIHDLRRQVPFELIPAIKEPDTTGPRGGVKPGKVIQRPVKYIADFVYTRNGETVVEDVKGYRTPEYKLKKKLMLWVHGIMILET